MGGFLNFENVQLLDHSYLLRNMRAKDCESRYLNNCSCTAYSYVNASEETSGTCLNWHGDLVDLLKEFVAPDPYVRIHDRKLSSLHSFPPKFIACHPLIYRQRRDGARHGEVSRVWCIGMVCYGESGSRFASITHVAMSCFSSPYQKSWLFYIPKLEVSFLSMPPERSAKEFSRTRHGLSHSLCLITTLMQGNLGLGKIRMEETSSVKNV
ncbi:hypothetical protein SADUNF_Sadunf19G0111200 [Salix dunnii]|uniref:Apple domain-containing protein n=1 Tax=Salix dunnii TaxID=1413687 RepID=A0A835J2D7_9ROSI|nr:hypothetical protein SADUNF_Sadunf19G0111200 [Salix dunnii]